jgi:hypothetical protein
MSLHCLMIGHPGRHPGLPRRGDDDARRALGSWARTLSNAELSPATMKDYGRHGRRKSATRPVLQTPRVSGYSERSASPDPRPRTERIGARDQAADGHPAPDVGPVPILPRRGTRRAMSRLHCGQPVPRLVTPPQQGDGRSCLGNRDAVAGMGTGDVARVGRGRRALGRPGGVHSAGMREVRARPATSTCPRNR